MKSHPYPRPLIGLLGGVGARASAHLHQRLMERCATERGALWDEDFPSVMHLSAPIPGLLETGVADEKRVLEHLMTVLPLFKAAGVEVLAPVCNSLHPYRGWLAWATGANVITPVDAAMAHLRRYKVKRALVLQSRSLAGAGVYRQEFAGAGIDFIEPTDLLQQQVDGLIGSLIAGKALAGQPQLLSTIEQLMPRGVGSALVMGCTELSLWWGAFPWHVVDSAECLVSELLEVAA